MKILELGKFYPPHKGGIETLLRAWAEGFVRRGAEVDCVVANDAAHTTHETINGVRVHRLASFGTVLSTSVCPAYLAATRNYPADLWHVQFPNPLADISSIAGRRATPLVLSYHCDVVRQAGLMRFYAPVLHALLRRATSIVVSTPQHLEYSPWLAPFRDKCEVIPFGINLAALALTPERERRVAELRREARGRPIVLNVGRLVGYKGQRFLLEALRELDAVAWIVGTGPLESELRAQAAALGVTERVKFLGGVSDAELPALLHACDVFALPSISAAEAFGIVQVEAMACGKPVVSCALQSGVKFVNQDGVTGLLVTPEDSAALAAGLRSLLGNAPLRQRLGAAARARAEREFAEDVMVARYWNCFERVLAARKL